MNKVRGYLIVGFKIASALAFTLSLTTFFGSVALSAPSAATNEGRTVTASTYEQSANAVEMPSLVEEFTILIKDFKVAHHARDVSLDIALRYRFKNGISDAEYPDYEPLIKGIKDFLTNYPNEVDYWEIINKKLTLMVLEKFPAISSITIEIQVSSSRPADYSHSTIVTRTRPNLSKPERKNRSRLK